MELGGRFEVEDGNGGDRDEVLAKLGVETFLIIPPKVTMTENLNLLVQFGTAT